MDTLTRRRMLASALLGGGYVGLRSMVSGIPISVLQSGLVPEARAEERAESITPQFLILCTSGDGDPINANCPGSYGVEGVYNNPHDALRPVEVALGDTISRAAAPGPRCPSGPAIARRSSITAPTRTPTLNTPRSWPWWAT